MRLSAGLTLREVARATGISATYLSDIEFGRRMPSRKILEGLAAAIEKPVDELLQYDPRESLQAIEVELTASPEIGPTLLKLCRQLRAGKLRLSALNKLAE